MAFEERRILERVADELRTQRELTRLNWERLKSTFCDRFDKAWRLVQERRVKRYLFRPSGRVVWIVIGQGGEYRILPAAGYCSCSDFYFRVVNGEAGVCYHLLGQKLAEALSSYEEVMEDDEAYDLLMEEWKEQVREED